MLHRKESKKESHKISSSICGNPPSTMLGALIRSSRGTNQWLDETHITTTHDQIETGADPNIMSSNDICHRSWSDNLSGRKCAQVTLLKNKKRCKKKKHASSGGKTGVFKRRNNFRSFYARQKEHNKPCHKTPRYNERRIFSNSYNTFESHDSSFQLNLSHDRYITTKQRETNFLHQTVRNLPPYKQLIPAYKSPPPMLSPLSPSYRPRFDASKPISSDMRVAGHFSQVQNAYSYSPAYHPNEFSNSADTVYYRSPNSPLYAPRVEAASPTYIPSNPSITFEEEGMSPPYTSKRKKNDENIFINNNDPILMDNDEMIFLNQQTKKARIHIETCQKLISKHWIVPTSTRNYFKKTLADTIRKQNIKKMLWDTLGCKRMDRTLVKPNTNGTYLEYDPEHPQYNHLVHNENNVTEKEYDPEHPKYFSD